jgi:glutathione S-transferase
MRTCGTDGGVLSLIRILGKASSINVRKVLWACEEIGLPYVREDWGSGYRDTGTLEFLALNPNGLVPVIVVDDLVLWESNTILRYLAASHGALELLPVAARGRAQVEKWMDWQATEFNNSWRCAFQALVRNNPALATPAEVDASLREWSKNIGILNRQLETTAYVAGEHFTLADMPIGLSVNRWFMTPVPGRPAYPAVSAYFDRLTHRPAFMRHGRNGVP